MDANDARKIEQEISNLLVEIFRVEGKNFFEKIQYLSIASKVHEVSKKSLIDDLNEIRKIRNNLIHQNSEPIPDDELIGNFIFELTKEFLDSQFLNTKTYPFLLSIKIVGNVSTIHGFLLTERFINGKNMGVKTNNG